MSGLAPVPDPYRVLGVPRGASIVQIKAAHRSLAKRYHPDAGGDRDRFLAVQDAYLLLSDPLRRRDWDARHAPGPVRAGEGTTRARRGATGHWTREEPEAGTRRGPRAARDPAARSHTWSAEGVPWWEDSPAARAARAGAARGRRPTAASGQGAPPPPSAPPDPAAPNPAASGTAASGRATSGPATGPPTGFDVYSRSSGAAWSSAARRYFRAGDSDLPSRGVFRRQGTQQVTGARAREMANAERAQADVGGTEAGRRGESIVRPMTGAPPPREAFHHDPPREPAPMDAAPDDRRAASHTDTARADLSRAAGVTPAAPLARSLRRRSSAPSPSLVTSIARATLAWIPLAALAAYGLPIAADCGGPALCADLLGPLQVGLAAAALICFVAFPRLAAIGAVATAAALLVAVPLIVMAVLLDLLPPPPPLRWAGLAAIFISYLIGALAAAVFGLRSRRDGVRPRSRARA